MGESRQRYNETFKREAVKYVQKQTKTLEQVADELSINPGTLRGWMNKYQNEPVNQGETLRQQSQLIDDQKHEIEDLKEEIEILKKAVHIFKKKELRFQFIEAHRSELRLEKMCDVLQVSRSGYYKWVTSEAPERQSAEKSLQNALPGTSMTRKKLTGARGSTRSSSRKAGRYRNVPLT